MASSDFWFLVPGDPQQRTGGYGYVREIVSGLRKLGRRVHLQGVEGRFPDVDEVARKALDDALTVLPEQATVLIDGLALCGCPEVAEDHGQRLQLVALVHHPLADETGLSLQQQAHFRQTERRALASATAVITTSETTSRRLADFDVPRHRVHTIVPGVHRPAAVSASERRTGHQSLRILCVAHLSRRKGQLDLVEALARVKTGNWRCDLVGSPDRDPDYAAQVHLRIAELGLSESVRLSGELSGAELEQAFLSADLFVLPSHYEGYGMVIDEALAYGLPVVSSDGGALADTASRSGCVTYPAGDVAALAERIRKRLEEPELLRLQQSAARESAAGLRSWNRCAEEFDHTLQSLLNSEPDASHFSRDWLQLREPADHQARDRQLTEQIASWLNQREPEVVVADIGTGRGSNWRYLHREFPPELAERCQWHLFDQDTSLLSTIETGQRIHLHPVRLEDTDLNRCLPAPLHLVTASALIDLVSVSWLKALAQAAAARSAAVLVVLSYAGGFRLTPGDPRDEELRALVNQHQHGDKGTGAACGPEASDALAGALQEYGYHVRQKASRWYLDHQHRALQKALMEGWIAAAREQVHNTGTGPATGWLDDWLSCRRDQAEKGTLVIEVDHMDLSGVPPF